MADNQNNNQFFLERTFIFLWVPILTLILNLPHHFDIPDNTNFDFLRFLGHLLSCVWFILISIYLMRINKKFVWYLMLIYPVTIIVFLIHFFSYKDIEFGLDEYLLVIFSIISLQIIFKKRHTSYMKVCRKCMVRFSVLISLILYFIIMI